MTELKGCKLFMDGESVPGVKEFEILNNRIPEPVFTPPAVELCPVINMEHDYRVYRHNGILTKIECRYCSHKLDIGNSEFIQIPGSAWYIQKSDTGRIERIPEGEINDDGPTITARDLIICSILLVVAIITIAAHWIFGG